MIRVGPAAQVGSTPTDTLTVGQHIKVTVIPSVAHKQHRVMLSCSPSALAAAERAAAAASGAQNPNPSSAGPGSDVAPENPQNPTVSDKADSELWPVGADASGVVERIGKDSVSVALSSRFSAHLYCLHASEHPEVAMALQENFKLGSVVRGRIIEAHERRTSLCMLPQTFAALY